MRVIHFRFVSRLSLCCLLWGCDRPNEADVRMPEPASPETIEAGKQVLKDLQGKSQSGMQTAARQKILRALGPVAEWQVSTDKEGKPDEALVKAKQEGAFDAILKKAFSIRGLTLKFFTGVPNAIKALRAAEPRPEVCDLICETPTAWKSVEPLLKTPDATTSDTNAAGQPREWHRYSDVSFGVVDGAITAVRLHLDSKERDWELLERR